MMAGAGLGLAPSGSQEHNGGNCLSLAGLLVGGRLASGARVGNMRQERQRMDAGVSRCSSLRACS